MPLASPKYPFDEWAVSGAPEEPGLYALYCGDELLCLGVASGRRADDTIRARLLAHLNGEAKRAGVSHYKWEITGTPVKKRQEYLRALAQRLPSCELVRMPPEGE